ncbi:hypothetical protein CLU79DRAFT_736088 [Phycomyces nitens]|nr:hypothetical protein CLU79DRAFT_736088 [Phycomyces nitens]
MLTEQRLARAGMTPHHKQRVSLFVFRECNGKLLKKEQENLGVYFILFFIFCSTKKKFG